MESRPRVRPSDIFRSVRHPSTGSVRPTDTNPTRHYFNEWRSEQVQSSGTLAMQPRFLTEDEDSNVNADSFCGSDGIVEGDKREKYRRFAEQHRPPIEELAREASEFFSSPRDSGARLIKEGDESVNKKRRSSHLMAYVSIPSRFVTEFFVNPIAAHLENLARTEPRVVELAATDGKELSVLTRELGKKGFERGRYAVINSSSDLSFFRYPGIMGAYIPPLEVHERSLAGYDGFETGIDVLIMRFAHSRFDQEGQMALWSAAHRLASDSTLVLALDENSRGVDMDYGSLRLTLDRDAGYKGTFYSNEHQMLDMARSAGFGIGFSLSSLDVTSNLTRYLNVNDALQVTKGDQLDRRIALENWEIALADAMHGPSEGILMDASQVPLKISMGSGFRLERRIMLYKAEPHQ